MMYFFEPKRLMIMVAILAVVLELRKRYFKDFLVHLRSHPFQEDRNLLIVLPFITLTALWADPFLLHQIQAIRMDSAMFLIDAGGLVGKNLWKGLVAFYLISFLARQEKWRQIFFGAFLAGGTTGLLIGILKFTMLRARPDAGLGPFSFFHLDGIMDDDGMYQSFPSGDVAIVAGAAFYLFYALKNRLLEGLILFVPLCTAFSRVFRNDHWPSDTLFSMGLSLVVAKFWWRFKKIEL